MIEINSLSDLKYYSNFETFEYRDKSIVLYDDHRCILSALHEARRLGIIDSQTNIVSFDRHDDARKCNVPQEMIDKFVRDGIENVQQREFKTFVEFDISEYDDDWVTVGMELGLINNILNVGNIENDNILGWNDHSYVNTNGDAHFGMAIGHINEELTSRGALGDSVRYSDFKVARDILGFNIPGNGNSFIEYDCNFVLDFDLDCFTTDCQGKVYAWPESIFRNVYGYDRAGYFMNEIIRKAKFITICREPSYCGGIGESNKILGYLDKYFFRGTLGTEPIS